MIAMLFVAFALDTIGLACSSLEVGACFNGAENIEGAGLLQFAHPHALQAEPSKSSIVLAEKDWSNRTEEYRSNSGHDVLPPFLSLYTFMVFNSSTDTITGDTRRKHDYCRALSQNAQNDAVSSIALFTYLSETEALQAIASCDLGEHAHKVSVRNGGGEYQLQELTYKLILGEASKEASIHGLQVVLNADLVVKNWWPVHKFLEIIHSRRISLHLSWNEQETDGVNRCEPGGDGSYDAVAFNFAIDDAILQTLDFQPNILGAEGVVVCSLRRGGFKPMNLCRDLNSKHIHTGARNYGNHGDRISSPECPFGKSWWAPSALLEDINTTDRFEARFGDDWLHELFSLDRAQSHYSNIAHHGMITPELRPRFSHPMAITPSNVAYSSELSTAYSLSIPS